MFLRLTTGEEKGDTSLASVLISKFEDLYQALRWPPHLNSKGANRLAANYLNRLLY